MGISKLQQSYQRLISSSPLVSTLDLLNDSSDGDLIATSDLSLTSGIYRYKDVNISIGTTVSVTGGSSLIIISKNPIVINGTLSALGVGALGAYRGTAGGFACDVC